MPKAGNRIIKITVKIAAGLIILLAGFYFLWIYPRYTPPILTYHSFDYRKSLLSVSPENFERQMRYLKDKRFNVISLGELIKGIKTGKKFSHNTIVITIDDGYENNFKLAYPILKKYGFPAIIFLTTDHIGVDKKFLTWNEIKEMGKNNISFGGHTKTHAYLPAIKDKNVLWNEIAGPKKVIAERAGIPVDYFCYPIGGLTEEVRILVEKAGYKGACTTNHGSDKLNRNDVYGLNRISVRNANPYFSFSNLCAPFRFRTKLSGYYNLFRKPNLENKKP